MTVVYTERCMDGRACQGLELGTAYIPDGQNVCDACLSQILGLEGITPSGCACCDLAEDAVTEASAVKVARQLMQGSGFVYPVFFAKSEAEYRDKKGKKITFRDFDRHHKTIFFGRVYDSREHPEHRTPVAEYRGTTGMRRAIVHAKRLNEGKVV